MCTVVIVFNVFALLEAVIVVVLGGGSIALLGPLGFWVGFARIAAEQREKERLKEEAAKEAKRREGEMNDLKSMLAKLEGKTEEAKKLKEKIANLEKENAEAAKKGGGRGGRRPVGGGAKKGGGAPPPPKPACRPGDPLCSDIGG